MNIHENSFKKGEILALQDEPANRLIILLKGSVKAEMTDPSGKVVKVEDIEAPNPLAVLFLFGRDNRFPVQATAREHVEAVVIPKQSILKMLSMNETILKNYLDISADFASPHDPAEDRHVPAAPRYSIRHGDGRTGQDESRFGRIFRGVAPFARTGDDPYAAGGAHRRRTPQDNDLRQTEISSTSSLYIHFSPYKFEYLKYRSME